MAKIPFKVSARTARLIGRENIASSKGAIIELVKNAYDADATKVKIIFEDINTPNAKIIVEDNGSGMSLKTVETSWLEIGTSFKRGNNKKPSKIVVFIAYSNTFFTRHFSFAP